jgi:hypothetical protein
LYDDVAKRVLAASARLRGIVVVTFMVDSECNAVVAAINVRRCMAYFYRWVSGREYRFMLSTRMGPNALRMDGARQHRVDDNAPVPTCCVNFAAVHGPIRCSSLQQEKLRLPRRAPCAAGTYSARSNSNWCSRCFVPASYLRNVFRSKPNRLAVAPDAARTPHKPSFRRDARAFRRSRALAQGRASVELRHGSDDLLSIDDWSTTSLRNNKHTTRQVLASSLQVHTVTLPLFRESHS